MATHIKSGQKTWVKVAKNLNRNKPTNKNDVAPWERTVSTLADSYALMNPDFNRQEFLDICYGRKI